MSAKFPRQRHKALTNKKGCKMCGIIIRKNRRDKNANAHKAFFSAKQILSQATRHFVEWEQVQHPVLLVPVRAISAQMKTTGSSPAASNANNEISFYTNERQGLKNFFITQTQSVSAYYLVKLAKAFRGTRVMCLTGKLFFLFNYLFIFLFLLPNPKSSRNGLT